MKADENIFDILDEKLLNAIKKAGFSKPLQIQQLAIPVVLKGSNVLLISPTGTGKTLAAMLPVFHLWLKIKPKPISILYVSPLKSLNRDFIEHMIYWCRECEMDVTVRHGDTSAYERKMQLEFPNDMMIITLETLQPLLVGKRIREYLRNVKWVIVDEVHEIVDSKRGVQLAVGLERLRELCGDFQLIMLSATIGEPERVARFLSGEKEVEIIRADVFKKMEVKVINPLPSLEDKKIAEKVFSSQETASRLRTLMKSIKNSQSTIVFTNTREFAEVLASRIKTLDRKFPVEVHHSSLSKEVRINAEKEFKEGKLKSLIATSSLQLGIDIGSIEQVLQYMSPRQITQLVQRVGRSGHAIEKVSKGIVFTTDEDDIFESAVIAKKALANELEKIKFHENSLDVLAHQITGLLIEYGRMDVEKVFKIITRAFPYKKLSLSEFLEVCKQMEKLGLLWMNP